MAAQVRHQLQNPVHFLPVHPAGGSIRSFSGVCKIPILIVLTVLAVTKAHDHNQQNGKQANTDQDAIYPVGRMEYQGQAGKKIRRWHNRRCTVSRDAAALLPYRIVSDKLRQVTSRI